MPDEFRPSRRIVFQGLGALGIAAVLAGCGGSDDGSGGDEVAAGTELADVADIPVGGGVVLTDVRIVITQPSEGELKAFSALCKHQGFTVGSVEDNTITCDQHGSQYDADTGDVTRGPATSGLDPISINVEGSKVVKA